MVLDRATLLARRPEALAFGAALLSGVLVASVWLPPRRPWAIALAFVPLLVTWLRANHWKQVLVTGVLAQWLISAIAFSWIVPSVQSYHDLPLPLAVACWVFAAGVTNLHIPLIGLAWWLAVRRYGLGAWTGSALLAMAWVGLAQFYPTFVPFDYGYPWLWSGLPILHLADWVGFSGLAGVTLGLNALLAFAWRARPTGERLRLAGAAVAVLIGLNGIGLLHGRQWETGERHLRVALIQPSFSWEESLHAAQSLPADAERAQALMRTSAQIQAEDPADLWVWPEGALLTPLAGGASIGYERWLSALLAAEAVPILTGAHWSAGPMGVHNSAVLFDRRGAVGGLYHKERLFPFGEYIPLVGRFFDSGMRYVTPREQQPGVLSSDGVRLGLTICFEALSPDLFRARADEGAQIFVNLSNDQPFGNTGERYQHLYMALARAIELRRPLVRVAQSGVSAVITRSGEVIAHGEIDEAWSRTVSVPFVDSPPATVFQRFGYLFEYACLAMVLVAVLTFESSSRRRSFHSQAPGLLSLDFVWLRPVHGTWLWLRGASLRELLQRACYLAVVLVGVSQPLGHALGWPGLRNLGMVSGASPLPLVFNAVNGYEYWAATYKLDLQLAQGEWRSLAVDSATFAGLPGPHRFHMVLTFPFMAGPILPERFWTGLLQYGLCHSGPLAAARAVPAEVRAGTIEIATANRPAWRGGFVCPR